MNKNQNLERIANALEKIAEKDHFCFTQKWKEIEMELNKPLSCNCNDNELEAIAMSIEEMEKLGRKNNG